MIQIDYAKVSLDNLINYDLFKIDMIDLIGGISVMVSDQGQAVKFYTEKLGFDIKINMPYKKGKWIEVSPRDSETTISLRVPDETMQNDEFKLVKNSIGLPTGIWLYTKDINSTFNELKGKGVDITPPTRQDWGGMLCKIKDIDGNTFDLISSPK